MEKLQLYLFQIRDREQEALRQLPSAFHTLWNVFPTLGLDLAASWFLINIRKRFLNRHNGGDIDLIAGNFANKEGTLTPSVDYLVAVEAKAVYLAPDAKQLEDGLKSTKVTPAEIDELKKQHEALLNLGFDRVFQLDILSTPPVGDWISALALAQETVRLNRRIFRARVGKGMPVGQIVWYRAAVGGGTEMYRGSGGASVIRKRRNNPVRRTAEGMKRRKFLVERLEKLFKTLPPPRSYPATYIDCVTCGKIHEVLPLMVPCEPSREKTKSGRSGKLTTKI